MSPALMAAVALDRGDRSRLRVTKTRAGPSCDRRRPHRRRDGSIAVLLMTEPSGARLPRGKVTVLVRPRSRRAAGRHDHVVRIDAVAFVQHLAETRAGVRTCSHQSRFSPSGLAGRRSARRVVEQPEPRRCSITSGTPPARNTRTVG